MNTVDWYKYRLVIENVPAEDGGGFRAYFPTLGYAPLGSGETVEEALASLEEGKAAVLAFVEKYGDKLLPPSIDDLLVGGHCIATNNFAYAA